MSNLCVSFCSKGGICAVLLTQAGKVLHKDVSKMQKYKSDDSATVMSNLIYSCTKAIIVMKPIIEDMVSSSEDTIEVVFECNNSVFVEWANTGELSGRYQEDFLAMMKLLDDLPLEYSFVCSKKPKALIFASEKYITKPKISGLNVSDYED